jgi:3-methyl-2-oxobutanoate hydroxymethyltransferase
MNIHDFQKMKQQQQKITMITCYDFTSAKIVEQTDVDCALVGDSSAMVMHGYDNTVNANIDMIVAHTQAVARGLKKKFLIADLPFLSYRKSLSETYFAVEKLMQAGAQAVKLEGAQGNLETIRHLVETGIPVMGHIGLTGQAVHLLGGHKVQGRNVSAAELIVMQAELLSQAGVFALVLECIPWRLAQRITNAIKAPTIGIGAGPHTDGQVLVLQDLLGLETRFKPKFVKTYLNGADLFTQAINQFANEVKSNQYPSVEIHSYEEETV